MQTLQELEEIPAGCVIRAHLLRSTIKASQKHRRALADDLGLLEERSTGNSKRIQSGHVGKNQLHLWSPELASPRMQQLTRYVYIDSGDLAVPTDRDGVYRMNRHYYDIGAGPSATVQVSRRKGRRSREKDVVRIEAQPDTYGIAWATELGSQQVAMAIGDAFPAAAKIEEGSVVCLSDSSEQSLLPGTDVGSAIPEAGVDPDQVSYLCVRVEDLTLTWFRSSYDSKGRHELGFGGTAFSLRVETLRKLLKATATDPLKAREEAVVAEAVSLLVGYPD